MVIIIKKHCQYGYFRKMVPILLLNPKISNQPTTTKVYPCCSQWILKMEKRKRDSIAEESFNNIWNLYEFRKRSLSTINNIKPMLGILTWYW